MSRARYFHDAQNVHIKVTVNIPQDRHQNPASGEIVVGCVGLCQKYVCMSGYCMVEIAIDRSIDRLLHAAPTIVVF